MRICRISIRRWGIYCAIAAPIFLGPGARADDLTSESVLNDALTAVNKIDDVRGKAQMLDQIAAAQAQTGDIAGAKQTVQAIGQGASNTGADDGTGSWKNDAYAAIAGAQAGRGDVNGAFATVKVIDDDDAKSLAFQNIAQALAKRGDLSAANAYASRLSGTCRARADASIAEARAAAGDFTGAKDLAKTLDDGTEQALALASISEIQAKSGDAAGALETAHLARDAAGQVYDYLSRPVYGAVARAEVKAGDLEGALALRKVDNSFITREIAIARAQMGDISGAKESLGQVSNSMDQACANAGIAAAQSKAGDSSGAAGSLDAARMALSTATNLGDNTEPCAQIVGTWAKFGDANAAADWARSQQDPTVEATTLISVARALGNTELSSNR